MQDYFKYDKIQGGAPLYMKSDSDGTTDKEKRALPLGIKSTTQGIKHFTNWNDIATSIDKKNSIRFEDGQPNSLFFAMSNRKSLPANISSNNKTFTVPGPNFRSPENNKLSFIDSWEANDIAILDNMAFVSYEDYTDINREDFDLGTTEIRQPVLVNEFIVYDGAIPSYTNVGSLVLSTENLPYNHLIRGKNNSNGSYEDDDGIFFLDNNFSSFDNCILKVEFTGKVNGKEGLGGLDSQYFVKKTLYFTYGGALQNELGVNKENVYLNPDTNFRYNRVRGRDLAEINDGDYGGRFWLVTTRSLENFVNFGSPTMEEKYDSGRFPENRTANIQLEVNFQPNTFVNYNRRIEYYLRGGPSGVINTTRQLISSVDFEAKVSFIKLTPVRKCGKIDVYVKKSGIISAIVGNRVTSSGHNLNTNDIIKISSALFDGTQEGAIDIHPLNGDKFVKKIDEDTFDLYDDQFFEKPSSTNKLKTTDGINWTCVGNSFGAEGQSWDYYKTIFSPTGRNGYLSKKNTILQQFSLSDAETFVTNIRPKKAQFSTALNNIRLNSSSSHSLLLDFNQYTYTDEIYLQNKNLLGNIIKGLDNNVPVSPFGKSVFGILNKAPQDFYPFHCVGDEDPVRSVSNEECSSYTGNKFGCSLDIKYSHSVGNTKIYTLIVGEKGSDTSVDFFGASSVNEYSIDGEFAHYAATENSIHNTFRQRIMPDNLPFGKIHVINIAVDNYGRITNISHENTIYGDGSSLKLNAGKESHPWKNWISRVNGFQSRNLKYLNGEIKYLMYSPFVFGAFESAYGNMFGGKPAAITYDTRKAPFDETMKNRTSLYWDRAAIMHWKVADIYDYFRNEFGYEKLLRNTSLLNRKTSITTGQEGENRSRFGYSGIGTSVPTYDRIDRFDISGNGSNSHWYIMPWVDSFGKSVALGDRDYLGNLTIFGGVTTRSNIDFERINDITLYNNGETQNLKRPLFSSALYNNYTIKQSKTESEIGQISCIILNSNYQATKFIEINAGGSVDSSFSPDTSQVISVAGELEFSPTINVLRTGHKAGNGINNAVKSCYWSAHKILYRDGYLIWADQRFGDKKATINVLKHEKSNNSFLPKSSVNKDFLHGPGVSARNCDGFGLDLRFDKNLLVTNGLTSSNDFGDNLSNFAIDGFTIGDFSTYDTLFVYTFDNEKLNFVQQISPTFNKSDSRYSEKLVMEYSKNLLDIGNLSYDNSSTNSLTWNIRLLGKYDVINDKILLKDPIEYVLFGRDYSYDQILSNNEVESLSTIEVDPYFYYSEIFEHDTIYYDYSNKSQFFIEDGSYWLKDLLNDGPYKIYNELNRTKTPVFFISLPSVYNGYYGDLKIAFNKGLFNSGRGLFATTNIDSGESLGRAIFYTSSVPKLVLYKNDPRSTIVPNGPSVNGNSTNITPYSDGIYTWDKNTKIKLINSDPYQKLTPCIPPLFRGGAHDLFYYGKRIGSVPSLMEQETLGLNYEYYDFLTQYYGGEVNLGELFDLTYNQLGNVNKGIISWVAPDNYYFDSNTEDIVPYAELYSSFTTVGDDTFLFSIPYSIWKNYIIEEDVLKGPSNNRPFFNNFTRIKHGVLNEPEDETFDDIAGNWHYTYDDRNRPSCCIENRLSNKTLILGLVFSAASSVDIRNNSVIRDQSTVASNYLRMMQPYESEKRKRYNSRYSYAPVVSTIKDPDVNLNFAERKEIISLYQVSKINNVDFSVDVTSRPKRPFNAKFHRVAYYEYNGSYYSEAQKNLIDLTTNKIDRYAFGKYSFTPFPIGISEEFRNSNKEIGASKNPIIRVGRSTANGNNSSMSNGEFHKSAQVLTTDSMLAFGQDIDSNYYVDDQGDKIYYDSFAHFSSQNFVGNFDIDEPEYLSLFISAIPVKTSNTTLYTKSLFSSGNIPLYASGIGGSRNDMTLWTGFGVSESGLDLVLKSIDSENYTSLFIEEIQPSGNISLQISGPSYSGSIPLVFAPAGTGIIPMVIYGPTQETSSIDLNIGGKALFFAQNYLYTSGIYSIAGNCDLVIGGSIFQSNAINLSMNIPQSGNVSLFIVAPSNYQQDASLYTRGLGYHNSNIDMFIGTQFDIQDKSMNLAIKDTERQLNNSSTLLVGGNIGYANNLNSRKGDSSLIRNSNTIDITDNSELPVTLSFNAQSTSSNAITRRNISSDYYNSKIKTINSNKNVYLGSQRKNTLNTNPAYITRLLDTNNNKARAFYNDSNVSDQNNLNSIIKRDVFDANGKNLILGYSNNRSIEIDIYDIVDNSKTKFVSKISAGLSLEIPNTDQSLDINYASNGVTGVPFGDSFVGLRRRIKDFFSYNYENAELQNDSYLLLNDLKISNLGRCAASITARMHYSDGNNAEIRTFDIILIFDTNTIKTGTSNISGFSGSDTYYVEDYYYSIYERSESGYSINSAAYNLAFDNEDVYFDRRRGEFGQIWKLSYSDNYSQDSLVIDFGQHPDAQYYANDNNSFYITEERRKAAFGVPVKIFKDNSSPTARIMFVGAHLFDPYIFNSLFAPHIPNAIGAVYVYKKANDNSDWVYFGAMYGKGNTSFNVMSNLSDYRDSSLGNQQYGLFGYDFDYADGRIAISEPGGNGNNPINDSKIYIFEISDSSIDLIETITENPQASYITSDPSGYNFVSHVVMLDRNGPITFSSDLLNNKLKNVFCYNESDIVTVSEARNNLSNETTRYETSQVRNLNPDLVTRADTVYSIKKLNFGKNNYRLGFVRNFSVRCADPYNTDPNYNFDIEKFFIYEPQKDPFSLYISGPNIKDGNVTLQINSYGINTENITTNIRGQDIHNDDMTLVVVQQQEETNIPLHIESARNNLLTLNVSGGVVPVDTSTTLAILPIPISSGNLSFYASGLGVSENNLNMKIAGSPFDNAVGMTSLYVGQNIDANSDTTLYMIGGGSSIGGGSTLIENATTIAISGKSEFDINTNRPLYISGPSSYTVTTNAPLYITTDIPEVGVGGGYSHSGNVLFSIVGNNDAGIFSQYDTFAGLNIEGSIGVSGSIPLFIERPTTNIATLFIKDQNPSGTISLAVSGAFVGSGDISLFISPPLANTLNIYTRGYLE